MAFFAKYLPVEDEIREGDKFINEKGIIEIAKIPDNYKNPHESYYSGYKKAKLFLCTSDNLQISDKVQANWDSIITDYVGEDGDIEQNLTCGGYEYEIESISNTESTGELLLKGFILGVRSEKVFKVIGEISKDAIWVRERDIFTEDQIQIWYRNDERKDLGYMPNDYYIWLKERDPEKAAKFYPIVHLKCSQCDTFH